ncbi:MAG TPA: FmdB family zinc ribbon protein [Actinomycetota bacterium]
MPTYEYVCKDCGHRFETWQSMSDDPLTICPECGGELRKVFAPPAISFKGSGFYATDHGKKAKPSDAGTSKKDGSSKPPGGSEGSPGPSSSGDRGSSGSSSPPPGEKAAASPKKGSSS